MAKKCKLIREIPANPYGIIN